MPVLSTFPPSKESAVKGQSVAYLERNRSCNMQDLEQWRRSAADSKHLSDTHHVEIFDASQPNHQDKLNSYFQLGRIAGVHDTLSIQLLDYLQSVNPRSKASDGELTAAFLREQGIESLANYGVWVYYPWSGRLVHTLPELCFRALRTDRNRHKISTDEQNRLHAASIGIVGLSAGMAVATCMVLEGVGGRFRIADFDTLGLSNLNRIHASIADIGIPKTTLAARTMLEMNPFLDVEVYPIGITEENIHAFFGEGDRGEINILVEECDSLWMKIRLREEAKRRAIPVVMDTSDRGLLDVERFDLENDRPLFHNLIGDTSSECIKDLSPTERIGFVLKILGADQLSPNASASLLEIGHTLSTWPQLGSSVIAGGAVVTDAVRRILLKSFTDSGRFSVDIESLVFNNVGRFHRIQNCEPTATLATVQTSPPKPLLQGVGTLTEQEFRWLVAHASLAPSGGNSQPWRFRLDDDSVVGFLATDRRSPILDYNYTASMLALGAAAENIMLSAPELGLTPILETMDGQPTTDPLFRIRFTRATWTSKSSELLRESELFREIGSRCTNRRLGNRQSMQASHLRTLCDEADQAETTLHILTSPSDLDAIAKIIGYGDRLRLMSEPLHRELMGELRWTAVETATRRDGIDVGTLELSEGNIAVLRLLSSWPTLARLRTIGGGGGLESPSRDAIDAASGVALLRRRSTGASTHFHGGRALQRIWLRATSMGLSIQPMSVLVYLFDRIENGDAVGLEEDTRQGLIDLADQFRKLFPPLGFPASDLLLFRIAYADPPTVRSNRLELDEMIAQAQSLPLRDAYDKANF